MYGILTVISIKIFFICLCVVLGRIDIDYFVEEVMWKTTDNVTCQPEAWTPWSLRDL